MSARPSNLLLALAAGLLVATLPPVRAVGQERAPIELPSQLTLADLVELTAARTGTSVQYDKDELRQTVTLRLHRTVGDDELWQVTQSVLEARGMAVVETDVPGLLRVVQQKGGLGSVGVLRFGDGPASEVDPRANFVAVVVRIAEVEPASAVSALQPLATPNTGVVRPLGETSLVLLVDTRSRIEQMLTVLERIDRPSEAAVTFILTLQHIGAAQAASTLERIFAARAGAAAGPVGRAGGAGGVGGATMAKTPPGPALIPLEGEGRLLVVCPPGRQDEVRALVAELDRSPAKVTRSYAVSGIGAEELAASIAALLELGADGVTTGAHRVTVEKLTGSVFVRADEAAQDRIAAFVNELAGAPSAMRRTLRTLVVRNRSAEDVRATLEQLQASATVARLAPTPAAGLVGDVREGMSPAPVPPGPGAPVGIALGSGVALTVDEATNAIIAIGEPVALDELEALVAQLDRRQPQVMIEVSLVALNENRAFDFGVELRTQFEEGKTEFNLASAFGLAADGALASGTGFTGTVIRPGDYQVIVRALETTNAGRTMSVPKILADNNQPSTLRSVARQPYTSINASDTVATTSFGGTEDAGTTITITPYIAQGDHLTIEYTIESSSFTGQPTATEGGGVLPPPSQQNVIDGAVTIPDGFTVVVGGLRTVTTGTSESRVPLLGWLPLVGPLFGTHSDSDSESRFYVFIRATILRDQSFEGLRRLSRDDIVRAGVEDGMPELDPIWIE